MNKNVSGRVKCRPVSGREMIPGGAVSGEASKCQSQVRRANGGEQLALSRGARHSRFLNRPPQRANENLNPHRPLRRLRGPEEPSNDFAMLSSKNREFLLHHSADAPRPGIALNSFKVKPAQAALRCRSAALWVS